MLAFIVLVGGMMALHYRFYYVPGSRAKRLAQEKDKAK